MNRQQNWLEEALRHETEFWIVLTAAGCTIEPDDTVESVYEQTTSGNRFQKWTILDFKKTGDGLFRFSAQDVGALSGGGESRVFQFRHGKVSGIEVKSVWRH